MWQRFSVEARKAVFYAQEEAQRTGQRCVDTEHLLLGILREDCAAVQVVTALGISAASIRAEVKRLLVRGAPGASQDMTLTPQLKNAIDLAYKEMQRLQDNYIGTEHLLAGLLQETNGIAGQVLESLGLNLEIAREAASKLPTRE